jgi:hypothetical protein
MASNVKENAAATNVIVGEDGTKLYKDPLTGELVSKRYV